MRRAEVIVALSLATDLAIGQPLEFALKSCVLSMRLARALNRPDGELGEIYHQALLRYIGCNADTYTLSALFGDEIAFRQDVARIDLGSDVEVAQVVIKAMRRAAAGQSVAAVAASIVRGLALGRKTSVSVLAGHCEVAERIAERLGFGPAVVRNLGQLYERWDGKGLPKGLKGEAVAPAVRLVTLAQDAIVLSETAGVEQAITALRRRRGRAYDPKMTDALVGDAATLLADLDRAASLEAVLALDPEPKASLGEAEMDEACLVIADFVDMRSPFTVGHSRAVAELATAAGRRLGLPASALTTLRRAALVHDLGEVSVSTAVWMKSGPLTPQERERIRLHPYYTERLLAPAPALTEAAALAGQHHERIDGSGYHRGLGASGVALASKLLAAVEAYRTRTEARPHRAALTPAAAASALKQEVRAGRLDAGAVNAVLEAAGHRQASVRRPQIADLTPRELEVLQQIARGHTTKEIARTLGIAVKTADNHIQGVYAKIGVSTRAGAVLFAVEHGLASET